MSNNELVRILAKTPRAAEYFSTKELQAQTGQPANNFATVVLKELIDNALDESENIGMPEIEIDITETPDYYIISVRDNGTGFPEGAVAGVLDFNTRVSTKTIYAAPTRGAQGNALKTILGIPIALGCTEPVWIESGGNKHILSAYLDPAGAVRTDHLINTSDIITGTKVTVTIPRYDQEFEAIYWAKAFSILNPHAFVKIVVKQSSINHGKLSTPVYSEIYKPLIDNFRKHTVRDLTSPWWYTDENLARLVFSNINANAIKKPLGEFIREFKGLTSTTKAKRVLEQLSGIKCLTDFEQKPELVSNLLEAMKSQTKPPKPEILGVIGKENFQKRFCEMYDVDRFWYQKSSCYIENIPFIFEVALAEVNDEEGAIYTGINFSPTYEDPYSNSLLRANDIIAYNLKGFLANSHCHTNPEYKCGNKPVVVAAHLVSPVLQFMDRGKTRLRLDNEVLKEISKCLGQVTKTLYKEEKRRTKDAAREERKRNAKHRRETDSITIKDSVFHVLPEAIDKATGNGTYPVSARSLYYQVRPLIQNYTNRYLDYSYFSQKLLTEYQAIYGPISLLYYDPRGYLYEPHTHRAIPLGTIEVQDYEWPSWVFNKILYVEKKGLLPTLQAAQLAERYDMAIIAAEGFATEAARDLLSKAAHDRQYKIFVLHDADPAGYEIARTLSEETNRMPGYSVEVIDFGLRVEDALDMGLVPETFTREKALPLGLELTDVEKEFFTGRQQSRKSWIAQRIELNAMTGPELIDYIELRLKQARATEKVLPPTEVVLREATTTYYETLNNAITVEIEERLHLDEIVKVVTDSLPKPVFDSLFEDIAEILKRNPPEYWRELVLPRVRHKVASKINSVDWSQFDRLYQRIMEEN